MTWPNCPKLHKGIYWSQSWNPAVGCTPVHTGCKNCWACRLHTMRHTAHKAGKKVPKQYAKPFNVVQMFSGRLDAPLRWRKPRAVAVCFGGDLFHSDVFDSFVSSVFQRMFVCPQHRFIVLTKRYERASEYCRHIYEPIPYANIYIGASVSDQQTLDAALPYVTQLHEAGWRTMLSLEPLLGLVELPDSLPCDWVIVGAESGKHRRPCTNVWIAKIVAHCRTRRLPVFVKQIHLPRRVFSTHIVEWPRVLQYRELPE